MNKQTDPITVRFQVNCGFHVHFLRADLLNEKNADNECNGFPAGVERISVKRQNQAECGMAGPISRPEMACCFHNLSVFINDPFS